MNLASELKQRVGSAPHFPYNENSRYRRKVTLKEPVTSQNETFLSCTLAKTCVHAGVPGIWAEDSCSNSHQ